MLCIVNKLNTIIRTPPFKKTSKKFVHIKKKGGQEESRGYKGSRGVLREFKESKG